MHHSQFAGLSGIKHPVSFKRFVSAGILAALPICLAAAASGQNPVRQVDYLKAPIPIVGDSFGAAIAVSGDLMVVGRKRSGVGTTVNAAYVFYRTPSGWQFETTLIPSNNQSSNFGASVDISGDTVVVGAFNENNSGVGVDPPQNNGFLANSGAAYIFRKTAIGWSQEAYLKASNAGEGDRFGYSVAVHGDRVVVGAYDEDSNAVGIDGDQNDNSAETAGAAYSFVRSGSSWTQDAYIKASNTDANDFFADALALHGNTLVVGAVAESSNGTGVNSDQSDNSAIGAGAAYVFENTGGAWRQTAYLKSDGLSSSLFGAAVAIDGKTIVCGGWGPPVDVYRRTATGWEWEADLVVPTEYAGGFSLFGLGVAVSEGRILVANFEGQNGGLGVNGNPGAVVGAGSGEVFSYTNSAGNWEFEHYLKPSNGEALDSFGLSLALDQNVGVIASFGEDSNGSPANNSVSDSGAVYTFDFDVGWASECGPAPANSSGQPASIAFSGSRRINDNACTLSVAGLPLNTFGYFLNARGHAITMPYLNSPGTLCLGLDSLGRHSRAYEIQNSGTAGSYDFTLDLTDIPTSMGPVAVSSGQTWRFQTWFRDNASSWSSNFSNSIAIQFE